MIYSTFQTELYILVLCYGCYNNALSFNRNRVNSVLSETVIHTSPKINTPLTSLKSVHSILVVLGTVVKITKLDEKVRLT